MKHCRTIAGLMGLTLMGLTSTPVLAQDGGAPPRWEVGAFAVGVSQQAYPGSETQLSRVRALPYVIYRGDIVRAEGGSAGLRALKTDRLEVDVSFDGAFGSSSNEVPARQGMPQLGTLVEFGPRVRWRLDDPAAAKPGQGRWMLELPVRGVFDLSDGLARRGLAFEPEIAFQRRTAGGLRYQASLGAIIADRRLAETFYGVAPVYATASRPAYGESAGLVSWRLGTSFSKAIAQDWRVFGFVRVDSVAGAANADSPLVRKTVGTTAGLGLSWTWMKSRQAGAE